VNSEQQHTNNAHTTSQPREGLHSDQDLPKLSQIQHITDKGAKKPTSPGTRHLEHKRFAPSKPRAPYHKPLRRRGHPQPHHDEKTSASTEEDDIPKPSLPRHRNHSTTAGSHTLVTLQTYAQSQAATPTYLPLASGELWH